VVLRNGQRSHWRRGRASRIQATYCQPKNVSDMDPLLRE
jgi:hypothetical protein